MIMIFMPFNGLPQSQKFHVAPQKEIWSVVNSGGTGA
jgi:hypothetical protein